MPEEQEELTVSKLRMLFVDILNGFSVIKQKSDDIYVKHLTFYDAADVDTFKREHEKIAEEKGLESEKVKLAELKKQELWDDKKEARIEELKGYVKNLTYSKSKLFLKREIDQISKQIKESEEELHGLALKKVELLGLTAEAFASKKVNEFYIFKSIYKNQEITTPYYSEDDFYELGEFDLMNLCKNYNDSINTFNDKTLKKISLSNFFLNHFYLSEDNANNFYGVPIKDLTFFQAELFGYARYFKSLMTNSKNKPPEDIKGDPDKLVEWFEQTQNAQSAMEKTGGGDKAGGSSLVGASKDELSRLGTQENGDDFINLAKEAAKKGGSLDMKELMKLHGV